MCAYDLVNDMLLVYSMALTIMKIAVDTKSQLY